MLTVQDARLKALLIPAELGSLAAVWARVRAQEAFVCACVGLYYRRCGDAPSRIGSQRPNRCCVQSDSSTDHAVGNDSVAPACRFKNSKHSEPSDQLCKRLWWTPNQRFRASHFHSTV